MQGPSEAFSSAVQQANEATTLAVQSVQEASSEVFEGINQAGADLQSSAEAAAASVSSQVWHFTSRPCPQPCTIMVTALCNEGHFPLSFSVAKA